MEYPAPAAYLAAMTRTLASARPTLVIFLLWLAGLGAAAQFAKIGVPFAEFEQLFPQAGPKIGWLLSLVSLIGAIFGMFAGILVTGLGLRRSLLAAMILGGGISILQSCTTSLGPLLLSRIVEGISHLLIVIAAPTLIAQLSPLRWRSFFMTLWATFFGVAYATMAWLGLDFIAAHGIPALFRLHGIWMLTLAALLWLFFAEDRNEAKFALPPPAEIWRAQTRAVRSPWIAAPGIGWLFYTLTFVSLLAVLPEFVPEERRAFITGTLPLVSIATSLIVVPILLRSFKPTGVVMAGFGIATLGAIGLLLIEDPSAAAALLFAALGIVQGASFAAVPTLNESAPDRALANGLMAQTGNVGNLLGTPLLLLMGRLSGTTGIVSAILVGYLAAIGCHYWLDRRRSRQKADRTGKLV